MTFGAIPPRSVRAARTHFSDSPCGHFWWVGNVTNWKANVDFTRLFPLGHGNRPTTAGVGSSRAGRKFAGTRSRLPGLPSWLHRGCPFLDYYCTLGLQFIGFFTRSGRNSGSGKHGQTDLVAFCTLQHTTRNFFVGPDERGPATKLPLLHLETIGGSRPVAYSR